MSRSSNGGEKRLPLGVTAPRGFWIDRDGNSIEIINMATKHIEATIAMLKRISNDPDLDHPKVREFHKALRNRFDAGDYYTGATADMTPFSLGFPNEEWVPELPALHVGSKYNGKQNYFATRTSSKIKPWAIFVGTGRLAQDYRAWQYFESIIMMVAWLHEHRVGQDFKD